MLCTNKQNKEKNSYSSLFYLIFKEHPLNTITKNKHYLNYYMINYT